MFEADWRAARLGMVMAPDPDRPEERGGVLNPAVARDRDGGLFLFPRIVDRAGLSRIGMARMVPGTGGEPARVERRGLALEPEEVFERRPREEGGGCEDPRITFLAPLACYVMLYTAAGGAGARLALAVSADLRRWRRLGLVRFSPSDDAHYGVRFADVPNKDGAFFPAAIAAPDGRPALAMLHRPSFGPAAIPYGVSDPRPAIWISYCLLDEARADITALTEVRWHHPLLGPSAPWESMGIGAGAPPVRTGSGWLLIYHGMQRDARRPHRTKPLIYSAGAALLDLDDPRRVLSRAAAPILQPETGEEIGSDGPASIFPTGVDQPGNGHIDLYYGMADWAIGSARLAVQR